jgi:hypothetical protein
VQRGQVNQARLFYLRDLSGKAARIKEREIHVAHGAEEAAAPEAAEGAEPKEKIKGRGKRKKKKEAAASAGA